MPVMRRVPERLVFIDGEPANATGSREQANAVKTNLTRLRGRALRGTRLTGSAPFGKWGTQTLIAGLTQDGLVAPWVIKAQWTGRLSPPMSARCWCQNCSPEPVLRRENDPPDHFLILLTSTTSPPITTPRPAKPGARPGAGFSSCHLTLPT